MVVWIKVIDVMIIGVKLNFIMIVGINVVEEVGI